MNISLIAAISKNLVIGYKNKIPWYLPEDLKWFKQKTINKNIIMGRLTWESIKKKPLPMRKNIVISSNEIKQEGIIWADSISNAIISAQYNQEIMIIGGAKIYKEMLFYANKLYLTHIDIDIVGDAYFPEYKLYPYWKTLFRKKNTKNKMNPYNYSFEILSR
ncbi:type 3 dihydrofolate reductase [Buchnera aphidicola str. APS (Acyrthosiphon pisum)]|uniref:Dihydrofolate reductase n=2 Tax=Buchnera aphidicola TaxID=9 RepID=DYR_BUCAI|nr:type 3 dihydrofolate reductase [Buchnera aphidicola]P57243.1 RecName: Full=Dihydrofolate reductase [Buchnera aphidicola str. APS (Acyrthosiphon pisum)]pir/E84946/ dihydrofolate reductase (EC 1.5.1.3) [imported] - Buchnera sp. (strain APS) [Buchnera sp. (in: enterobacteria)]ADP66539.1 dihydrofolate reductase [Buchnera aphidicola str. TLW03 (Acyrthosiphon pisum)]ADP67681.1 dihydrofolate reductase [Buchnera aphidicola str. JF98 (Acyrthosiphon pisum)]OQX98480.1 MAG: dihydrofolate reductase [Erw